MEDEKEDEIQLYLASIQVSAIYAVIWQAWLPLPEISPLTPRPTPRYLAP
jgi:hypothetical protein